MSDSGLGLLHNTQPLYTTLNGKGGGCTRLLWPGDQPRCLGSPSSPAGPEAECSRPSPLAATVQPSAHRRGSPGQPPLRDTSAGLTPVGMDKLSRPGVRERHTACEPAYRWRSRGLCELCLSHFGSLPRVNYWLLARR